MWKIDMANVGDVKKNKVLKQFLNRLMSKLECDKLCSFIQTNQVNTNHKLSSKCKWFLNTASLPTKGRRKKLIVEKKGKI